MDAEYVLRLVGEIGFAACGLVWVGYLASGAFRWGASQWRGLLNYPRRRRWRKVTNPDQYVDR